MGMDNSLLNKGFEHRTIIYEGVDYNIMTRRRVQCDADAPRLLIISYMPKKNVTNLAKLSIQTIQRFTDTPYELWVIDNNSPRKHLDWLIETDNINLAFIRTAPNESGSYANALGLEVGIRLIDPDTRYVMTLHQDIAVCKSGWLSYMISKFDDSVRAVGVRKDITEIGTVGLHVLGYIVDFQLFKQLGLSFAPDWPDFDVGDKAIWELTDAGYEIFYTPNTYTDPSLIDRIPEDSKFRCLQVDRSFDDKGDIFFMHLGRGVAKSLNKYDKPKFIKSPRNWKKVITKYILDERHMTEKDRVTIGKWLVVDNPNYSVRRFYIDNFFTRHISLFPADSLILDMGGKKKNKRGLFNIEDYDLHVKYANIDKTTEPDYLCNLAVVPVDDGSFDGVVISEVLEHVPDPGKVLKETCRILKPGGRALICTPFLLHVHPDPVDYGRYTDHYFETVLADIGFRNISIEKQGGFFSVLANMLKLWAYEEHTSGSRSSILKRTVLRRFVEWFVPKALEWDTKPYYRESRLFSGHTTGYSIVCEK